MIIEGRIFPYKNLITKLYEIAEKGLKEDFSNVNISINFVSEEEIKELNGRFRQLDKVTDVLSFPNLEKKVSQKLVEFNSEIEDEGLFLGDIVICKKRAYQQAKDYGHSRKREVCFLALHGLLHLLGYDHIEKQDEIVMQEVADKILNEFGVTK